MKRILVLLVLLVAPVPAVLAQNYPYVISTLAGVNPLGDGGPATAALLEFPTVVGVDAAAGVVYINDAINGRLRQISPNGTISTFKDGSVVDFKLDAAGNLYGVDGRYTVLKLTRSGTVSVIAGAGIGFAGDSGPATQARFNGVRGIAIDGGGNIFIADTLNQRVRKIAPDGTIQTVAG